MKLKIITLFFLLLFVIVRNTNAQSGFGAGVYIGWGDAAGISEINSSDSQTNDSTFSDDGVYGSYGEGINFGLRLRAPVCESADLGLTASRFMGRKIKYSSLNNSGFSNFTGDYTEQASGFYLEPQIGLHTHKDGKCNFYTRQGLIIPFGVRNMVTTHESTIYTFNGNQDLKMKEKEIGRIGLGYSGAMGVSYKLNDHIDLTGEMYYRGVNMSWKTGSLTEYTNTYSSSGITTTTTLTDLEVSQKEVVYKKSISNLDNQSDNLPTTELMQYRPYSSWGVGFGLIYNFGPASR